MKFFCLLFVMAMQSLCLCSQGGELSIVEKHGKDVGQSIIASAQLLAAAGIDTEEELQSLCDDLDDSSHPALIEFCRRNPMVDAIIRLDDAMYDGLLEEESLYEKSFEPHIFETLFSGLKTSKPEVKWHILRLAYAICSDTICSLLSSPDREKCRPIVEEMAIWALTEDKTRSNQSLALEVLSNLEPTPASIEAVTRISTLSTDTVIRDLAKRYLDSAYSNKKR